MWRWGKNPYARQSGNASRNQRESEKPGRITGTVSAPVVGAHPPVDRLAQRAGHRRGVAGDLLGELDLELSASSPSTSAIRLRAASSPSPGGTRQSTLRYARDGITLILSDAWAIVGVSVTPNIGSIDRQQRRVGCGDLRERRAGITGVFAEAAAAAPPAPRSSR